MLTTVPFSGFYASIHDAELTWALEQMFADGATGYRNEGLETFVSGRCNWREVYTKYAKAYVESFAKEFDIPSLAFESLSSPREYNFETDRIFATIDEDDVGALYLRTARDTLDAVAEERFTSRSGFISHYSPCVADWPDLYEWDHNQVGTLLLAAAGEDFDQFALMEDYRGNGCFEHWIHLATPGIDRAYRIHDYLEERRAR